MTSLYPYQMIAPSVTVTSDWALWVHAWLYELQRGSERPQCLGF
jgi:hypothetical protein